MVHIYNSLTRKKEELQKPKGRSLKLFVCGPTIYNDIHIGNARTFASFDTIVRYLRSQGYDIDYVQNITDIDDKIIDRARKENVDWKDVSQKYTEAYHDVMKQLHITSVDTYAPALDHIDGIVDQIKRLIEKGHVYKIDGDGYYFDITSFRKYGEMAGRTTKQAEDGYSRIDDSSNKKHPGDFAVWKFSPSTSSGQEKPGEPVWEVDIGAGRPGWHIEDTAISEKFFGLQYDLHGGGMDLKFPHHEAEIAIAESLSGKEPFVNVWMHAGFINMKKEKMSKSAGNFKTAKDFLSKHLGNVFRMIVAQHHYRMSLEYSGETVQAASAFLQSIKHFVARVRHFQDASRDNNPEIQEIIADRRENFVRAMNDDFNSPKALADGVASFMADIESHVESVSESDAEAISHYMEEKLGVFGIALDVDRIPENVQKIADERELLRTNKQFTQADTLREKIEALGYSVEDTPRGPLVTKN